MSFMGNLFSYPLVLPHSTVLKSKIIKRQQKSHTAAKTVW